MKKCEKCGAMIPDKAKFCSGCGARNQLKKKQKTRIWIIILCLVCFGIIAAVMLNKFVKNDDGDNAIKNSRAVLYKHKIYYLKNRTLYKSNEDGTKQTVVKKLPHKKIEDEYVEYDQLQIYKGRLYGILEEEYSMERRHYIFSINLDGTDYKREIVPKKADKWDIDSYSIEDDYIYYILCESENLIHHIVYKQKLGSNKEIKIKYIKASVQLYGKYAYYHNIQTGDIIKLNLETQKEKVCIGNISLHTMGVSKNKLVLATEKAITWVDLKDGKNHTKKIETANKWDIIEILRVNDEEVCYAILHKTYNAISARWYKMNFKNEKIEELVYQEEQKIYDIDLIGNRLAISGSLNENGTGEFIFFVKEKDGINYKKEIRKRIESIDK